MVWFFGKKKDGNQEKKPEAEAPKSGPGVTGSIPSVPDTPKKFKVRYEWKKCIGSAVCEAVAPQHFKVENGKATLLGSKIVDEANKVYEKEITEAELDANKMAADGCPPNCIHVINIETGEEIAPKK